MIITMFSDKVFNKKFYKSPFISLIVEKHTKDSMSNQVSSNKMLTKSIRSASMKIEYPTEYETGLVQN